MNGPAAVPTAQVYTPAVAVAGRPGPAAGGAGEGTGAPAGLDRVAVDRGEPANRPDIVRAVRRDRIQVPGTARVRRVGVGHGHLAPLGTVPVLDERAGAAQGADRIRVAH